MIIHENGPLTVVEIPSMEQWVVKLNISMEGMAFPVAVIHTNAQDAIDFTDMIASRYDDDGKEV